MKTYMISYNFATYRGTGFGRSFAQARGGTSPAVVVEWEAQIKRANPSFDFVGIIAIVELDHEEGFPG